MPASRTRARTGATRTVMAGALLAAALLAGCSSKPTLPSNFEVIGMSSTDAGKLYTVRDNGTGCEFISGAQGLLPRNERSADGMTVKQRCVITGDETPAPVGVQQFGNTPTAQGATPGQPALAPQTNAVGADAQEQALRAAIREQTTGAIPPAAATAPSIPPPKGVRRAQQSAPAAPAAQPQDGVESQLK